MDAQRDTIDWGYLRTWLSAGEATLLADVSAIADDELVRRLLAQ